MKLRMLFVAMVLFAMASVSQAQFNAILINTTPLTDGCSGGEPFGAGCYGTIYWDGNNNGVDAADLPARIDGSPFGQANFNQIDMASGNDLLGIPGGFATDPAFTISTNTPAPSRYYVKVACGTVAWTSVVFTILDGLNDYDLSEGWTCAVTVVPCNEPTHIDINTVGGRDFLPEGAVYTNCFRVCANVPVTICLGPLSADETPVSGFGECQGTPAVITVDPAGWQYNAGNSTWCLTIVGANDGCVCFRLDDILSAENGSFDAVARDNSVELNWNTLAESNVASFDVMRKVSGHASFDMVGNVVAANSNSGANYSFVDNSAVNGTSYEYTLQTVNLNGSRESWGVVVNVTPSIDAAVITEYALLQNYPNPFNPSTNLVFDVVAENNVNLTVYNAMGQEVASLVNGTVGAGRHTVSFDATNLTSGLYFYTVKIGNEFTATKKMLLVK